MRKYLRPEPNGEFIIQVNGYDSGEECPHKRTNWGMDDTLWCLECGEVIDH
jgi:hypothetical protein